MQPFEQFVRDRRRSLSRIAAATKHEHSYDDVVHEAWIMAKSLAARRNIGVDFLDPEFQELLLAHLYQELVRYRERHVRHATRLDAPAAGAEDGAPTPADRLAAHELFDPLAAMIANEEGRAQHDVPEMASTLAGAYVLLLRHFDNRMLPLARHLLISRSHAYRCYAKVTRLAEWQQAIAFTPPCVAKELGPWRRRRAQRIPRQLEFPFDLDLPLSAA